MDKQLVYSEVKQNILKQFTSECNAASAQDKF